VDRFALAETVQAGTLAGAALDVYDYEPLCDDDPLLKEPRIICTPHIGGASRDVISHQPKKVLEALRAYSAGAAIPYRIA
jgi:D-3-phosphoglycerate dehydrogenase